LQKQQPRLDLKRLVFIDETSVSTTIIRRPTSYCCAYSYGHIIGVQNVRRMDYLRVSFERAFAAYCCFSYKHVRRFAVDLGFSRLR
jgi:hypothetical protein